MSYVDVTASGLGSEALVLTSDIAFTLEHAELTSRSELGAWLSRMSLLHNAKTVTSLPKIPSCSALLTLNTQHVSSWSAIAYSA